MSLHRSHKIHTYLKEEVRSQGLRSQEIPKEYITINIMATFLLNNNSNSIIHSYIS